MGVAGVALAQQGLIIEPWRKSPAPLPQAAPRAAPERLPPVTRAPGALPPALAPATVPGHLKWSPTVVELLVDPWARERNAPPQPPSWVPHNVEIIDPWAEDPPEPPRVASAPPPRRSTAATIF